VTAIEIQLLGRFCVRKSGAEIPPATFRGRLVRVLVRLLVTRRGCFVARDVLAEALWPDRMPADPAANLWTLIGRARAALGDASLIVTGPGGYSFVAGDGCVVDTEVFLAAVQAGQDHLAAGRIAAASGEFRSALERWAGEPLAEDAYDDWAQEPRAVLSRAYLLALEGGAEAALASGEPGQAVVLAERAIARERLREPAALLLARAQAGSGDLAASLRTIDALRRRLAEEAGLELSPEAVSLETSLQRGEPVAGAAHPAAVASPGPALEGLGSTVPMPLLLTEVGRIFVGRDAELDRLGRLWKEAVAGERRVVLLAGEPGVGKTRLAAELAARTHKEGAVVLAGRCDEDLGVPYQPFVEALRHFVDHAPVGELKYRLGRYGGELARLMPDLNERVPALASPLQSDPETERYRLFDAVAGWMATASSVDNLLLLLDDLQWAAKPTLLLLRHLLRAPDTKRVLILGIYRDTELDHDHPLTGVLADLRGQGGIERISLSGLDDHGVRALAEQAAGHALDDHDVALMRAIREETEGNPFFVREVFRHLVETGAVERRQEGWTSRMPAAQLRIPESVRDVVGRRLSRLSDEARRALRVAAVTGAEFDVGVVSTAGAFDEETLLGALEEAGGARLLNEVSATRYRFAHALVRITLYESLTAARRVALHRQVAGAIETLHARALDDHLPALAHHWARASGPSGDTARAVHYAARAGDRALAQLAHDEAVVYYRQALELLDVSGPAVDDQPRCELLISLGESQRRAGDPAFRETLLTAAHLAVETGDAERLTRAALANQRGIYSMAGAVDPDRVTMLEAAVAAQGDSRGADRARLLAELARETLFAGDSERTRRLADNALEIIERHEEPTARAQVLIAVATAIWGPDTIAERLDLTAQLLDAAHAADDPVLSFWAYLYRAFVTFEVPDRAEVAQCVALVQERADELRQPVLGWLSRMASANLAAASGRLAESQGLAAESYRLGQSTGQPDAAVYFGANQLVVRLHQGRMGEVADDLDRATESAPAMTLSWRTWRAVLHCEEGQQTEARPLFEAAMAQLPDEPKDPLWLPAVVRLAAVCAHLADADRALQLSKILAPYEHQAAATGATWFGSVSHYLGLLATVLGEFDTADDCFVRAEDTHEGFGAVPWTARTRLEWANMLLIWRRPGDVDRARRRLGQALAAARELGLGGVKWRAVTLLRDCS
jgi:DNA-binding SARP family transcriptional activator/tetratricopeptide (TPR) repeat protein